MPCSAVTLSLATITGIIATALLAIAFSTDNWLYTEVKRAQIQVCNTLDNNAKRIPEKNFVIRKERECVKDDNVKKH